MEKCDFKLFSYLDSDYCNIDRYNKDFKIEIYKKFINYNAGLTEHYEISRKLREKELLKLLGKGKPLEAFLVSKKGEQSEIQEILDNGIIKVYSCESHKKITLFAPRPERIEFLYNSVGINADIDVIIKSEENTRKGYNKILT